MENSIAHSSQVVIDCRPTENESNQTVRLNMQAMVWQCKEKITIVWRISCVCLSLHTDLGISTMGLLINEIAQITENIPEVPWFAWHNGIVDE